MYEKSFFHYSNGSMSSQVHYSFSDVHFLPNGYLNGKTVRVSFLGNSNFSFLDEDLLRTWYQKLYFENTQISPKAILDVGTGTGGSAFVLGELFPKAYITVRIILSIRLCIRKYVH